MTMMLALLRCLACSRVDGICVASSTRLAQIIVSACLFPTCYLLRLWSHCNHRDDINKIPEKGCAQSRSIKPVLLLAGGGAAACTMLCDC